MSPDSKYEPSICNQHEIVVTGVACNRQRALELYHRMAIAVICWNLCVGTDTARKERSKTNSYFDCTSMLLGIRSIAHRLNAQIPYLPGVEEKWKLIN